MSLMTLGPILDHKRLGFFAKQSNLGHIYFTSPSIFKIWKSSRTFWKPQGVLYKPLWNIFFIWRFYLDDMCIWTKNCFWLTFEKDLQSFVPYLSNEAFLALACERQSCREFNFL